MGLVVSILADLSQGSFDRCKKQIMDLKPFSAPVLQVGSLQQDWNFLTS